jgi:hypothetical protein
MDNPITFSQALEGYLLHADAHRLSPHTIADYTNASRKFQQSPDDDPPSPLSPLTRSAPFACLDHLSKKTTLIPFSPLYALLRFEIPVCRRCSTDSSRPSCVCRMRRMVETLSPAFHQR